MRKSKSVKSLRDTETFLDELIMLNEILVRSLANELLTKNLVIHLIGEIVNYG